jgi:hypothetical protein
VLLVADDDSSYTTEDAKVSRDSFVTSPHMMTVDPPILPFLHVTIESIPVLVHTVTTGL